VNEVKLIRIGEPGREKPAVLVDPSNYVDVSDHFNDFDEAFFRDQGVSRLKSLMATGSHPHAQPLGDLRLGPPVARPHQIICIGLNYADHAAETGAEIPPEPVMFTKSPNTLVGPTDPIRLPRNSDKTDWEVELAIVVGARASYLESADHAADYIAGYMVCNDVSEREFQLERSGQWSKGKSCETFNPAGPWLVTPDEVPNPQNLAMRLSVNGVTMQDGSTRHMVYGPNFLVHYLSQFLVLEPGDIINTGTPPGVGMGQKPPQYLRAGDVVELEIEGLGSQRQVVLEART